MVYILRIIDALELVIIAEKAYENTASIDHLLDTLVHCKGGKNYFVFKPYVVEYCDHFTLKVDEDDELIYNVFVNLVDIFEGLQYNLPGE